MDARDVAQFVQAAAAVGTAIAAWRGVSLWREQLQGTVGFQSARRALRSLAELRVAFEQTRNAFMSPSEYSTRPTQSEETQKEAEARDLWYGYQNRLEQLIRARNRLRKVEFDARAVFGLSAQEVIVPIYKHVNVLGGSATTFFSLHLKNAREDSPPRVRDEQMAHLERFVWESTWDQDKFAQEISRDLVAAETFFRDFLPPPTPRKKRASA